METCKSISRAVPTHLIGYLVANWYVRLASFALLCLTWQHGQATQIAEGLTFLHINKVVHGDVKDVGCCV
jgi:hypothetical protein